MLKDALYTPQGLDHVCAVGIQVPQLAVVAGMRPPKGIAPQQVVLLKLDADAPALVVGQRLAVLLEERIDARHSAIPAILQVLQSEAPILHDGLLALHRILGPDALRVEKLTLPRGNVSEEVWNELVLLVGHARAKVRHGTALHLLAPPQVTRRNEYVAHREHPQAAQFFGRVKDDWREARRHLAVETHLDARLHLVLCFYDQVEQLARVHDSLAVVRHQADERRIPLVGHLCKRRRARAHEEGANTVVEPIHRRLVDAQEGLGGALLCLLMSEGPHAFGEGELLILAPHLWQDAHVKAAHCKKQVWVGLRVDRHKRILPLNVRQGSREAPSHLPKDGPAKVHVMPVEAHAAVARPALFVVIPNDVLIVRIGILT